MPRSKKRSLKKVSSSIFSLKVPCFLHAFLILVLTMLVAPSPADAETYAFVNKWGSEGSGNGEFDRCIGLAVDSSGNVYVGDRNNRIQKFDSNGKFLTKWGAGGTGDGQFRAPHHIAVDGSGNVYVADYDNHRVQKFDSNGTFLKKWGTIGTGDGQFSRPFGIAVDSSDNVYVSGLYNHRIQKFDSNGGFITKWGSNGTGDGQFNQPIGIAFDSSGNVFVADQLNHRIQKFSSTGTFLGKWGIYGTDDGEVNGPSGIAIDSADNVYVAEWGNQRIQKFTANGGFITKWGGNGSGDGQFYRPVDIALDDTGNVYVPDCNNHRVQKFSKSFVAYWAFDEGSGSTARDTSGNEYHGTISGASYTDGKLNKCLSFNGSSNRVEISNSENLGVGATELSISAWINMNGWNNSAIFWKGWYSGGNNDASYYITVNNGEFNTVFRTTNNGQVILPKVQAQLKTWTHLAVVFGGGNLKLFINGKLKASKPASGSLVGNGTLLPLGIGYRELVDRSPALRGFYNGLIDEVKVFRRALTTDEIEFENKKWYKYAGNPVIVGDSFEINAGGIEKQSLRIDGFMKEDDTYKLWYSWDPSSGSVKKLSYATSSDGITWTKQSTFNMTSTYSYPVERVKIFKDGSTYKLYIGRWWPRGSGNNMGIMVLESSDGKTWTGSQGTPAFYINALYFSAPIIKDGNTYRMWYGHARDSEIWYATSPDGITWTDYKDNPVIPKIAGTEESLLIPESVQKKDGIYYLVYTAGPSVRQTYLAYSYDGINWIKHPNNPLVKVGSSGEWDINRASTAQFIFDDNDVKIVYNGYNPDTQIPGIGLATTTGPPLIAHYKFDEGSGTTATDSSGNKYHGSITGGTYVDGKYGKALKLDGNDDFVDCGKDKIFNLDDDLTISTWIKPEVNDITMNILAKAQMESGLWEDDQYDLIIYKTGKVHFSVTGNGFDAILKSNKVLNTNTWYFITAVYKKSDSNRLVLYINGVEDNTMTSNVSNIVKTDAPLYIGTAYTKGGGTENHFNGLIDDVKIFNRALTADEIKYEYHGLVAYYKFDESSGTTAWDATSNGNNGILKSGPTWQSTGGKYGGALKFDGSNDYVDLNRHFVSDENQTVALWLKPDSFSVTSPSRPFAQTTTYQGHVSFDIAIEGSKWYFRYHNSDGTTHKREFLDGIDISKWTHLIIVKNKESGKGSFYLNGNLLEEQSWDGGHIGSDNYNLLIGCVYFANSLRQFYNGLVDDVRIYRKSLSEIEIKELIYNDYKPPTITLTEPAGDDDKTTESKPNYTIKWTDDDPDSDAKISLYYTDKIWFYDDFEDGTIDESISVYKSGGDITEHDGYLDIDSSAGNSQVAYGYYSSPLPSQYHIEIEYSVKKDNLFISLDNSINPGNENKRIEFPPSPTLLVLRYWTGSETKYWTGSSWVSSIAEILRDNTHGMTGKHKYTVTKSDTSYIFKLYDENGATIYDTSSSPVPLSAVNGGTTPDYLIIGDDLSSNVALKAQIYSLSIQSGTDDYYGGTLVNKLDEPQVSKIGDLPSQRRAISATAYEGKIYVIGGHDSSGGLKDIIQIDPSSGDANKIGNLTTVRNGHGAAEIGGKIYLCAGSPGEKKDVIEIDPLTGSETFICNLPSGREGPAAVAYGGKIYVIGGYTVKQGQGYLSDIIEVDPIAKTATKIGDLPSGRNTLAAVTYNGNIYAIGGKNCSEIVEINPSTGEAVKIGDLPSERSFLKAVVSGGKIYVIGGTDNSTGDVSDILEIDPFTGTATKIGDLPSARFELAAAEYNGSVYAIGGRSNGASILYSDIIKIQIEDSLSEDSATDSYTWDTTDVPAGEYYIVAKIKDFAHDLVWSVSPGKVKVKDFKFYEYADNPVLKRGADVDYYIDQPCVIKDGNTYKMWYVSTNKSITKRGISYAESPNGLDWTKYSANPVLVKSESYESEQIYDIAVIKEDGLYKMWYNASIPQAWACRIVYATSPDGINWTKHGMVFNYTGKMGGHHDVIKVGNEYILYFYTSWWGSIRYATSDDGINWTDQGIAVGKGANGEFDSNKIRMPIVVKKKNSYVMFYWGNDAESGSNGEVDWGYAESTDAKIWTKKGQVTVYLPDGSRITVRKDYDCALYDNGIIKIWFDTDQIFGYHSSSDNTFPTFTFTEPDGTKDYSTADDPNYTIKWTATDPDDDAIISFHYDDDNKGWDGTGIGFSVTEVGNLPKDRLHSAVEYVNGKYYLLGGAYQGGYHADILEVDPSDWSNQSVANLPSARDNTASATVNGKIYLMGGYPYTGDIIEFDPSSGSVSKIGQFPDVMVKFAAAALDGKIYTVGGWKRSAIYRVDPSDGTVTKLNDLPQQREGVSVTAYNGKIYAIGGDQSYATNYFSEILEINPENGLYTKIGDLPYVINHTESVVVDGKIYCVGGNSHEIGQVSNILQVDPSNGRAIVIGDLPHPLHTHVVATDGQNIFSFSGHISETNTRIKTIFKISPFEVLTEGTDTSYTWNTTDIDSGKYYLYAKIDDRVNPPIFTYSDSMVYVNAPKPEITVNPVPPLIVGDTITLTGWRNEGTEKVTIGSKLSSLPTDDTWAIDVTNLTAGQENTITLDPYSQYLDGDLVQVKVTAVDPGDMKSAFQTDWSAGEYNSTYKFLGAWDWFKSVTKSETNSSNLTTSKDITVDPEQFSYMEKWGSQGSGEREFDRLGGIAVDTSGNIYLAEHKNNNRIQKFSSNGEFIKQWGSLGTANGQFNHPYGLAFDKSGALYVVDSHNNRIQKFSADGDFITKWGSKGTSNGQFITPCGIAFDDEGNIYICDEDNLRIQKFSSDGTFITKWGSKGTGNGQFMLPGHVAIDGKGDLYITDGTNHRIQKFAPDGTFLTKWGSKGTGNGQFNFPTAIAIDKNDIIYVAEHENHRIQMFSPDGTFLGKFGEFGSNDGQFKYPAGIAFDSFGGILVTEMSNYRIQRFGPKGQLISSPIDTGVWTSGEKRSSFSTVSWASPATIQPLQPDDETVVLYPFDGNAQDDGSGSNNGSMSNITFSDDTSLADGKSAYFNGSSSITIPDSTGFNFFDEMTVMAWIKRTSGGGMGQQWHIVCTWAGNQNNREYWLSVTENKLHFYLSPDGADIKECVSNNSVPVNTWVHVAATLKNKTITLYMNGAVEGTQAYPFTQVHNSTIDHLIGADMNGYDYSVGYIDELAILKKALAPAEIALAAGILNPGVKVALRSAPKDANPVNDDSLWGPWMGPLIFQDNFNDGNYEGWDVTNGKVENGKLVISSTSGSTHTAVKDGFTTHDRVTTFDMKAELGEYGGFQPVYAACRVTPTPYPGYSGVINIIPYDGAVRCGSNLMYYDNDGNSTSLGSSFTTVTKTNFKVGALHEYGIGIVSDTADYFIDGKRIHTVTQDFIKQFPDNHHLVFKIDISAPANAINMYADNVRVSKTYYEAADQPVSDDHPEILKSEQGLILHCRFEDNANSEEGYAGTINKGADGAGCDFVSGKIGQAIQFDGDDDYVSFNHSTSLNPKSSLTIQAWVKPTKVFSTSVNMMIVDKRLGDPWPGYVLYITGNPSGIWGSGAIGFESGQVSIGSTEKLNSNEWSLLALIYDGSGVKIYVNGIKCNEIAQTGEMTGCTNNLFIGQSYRGNQKFEGLIDDVKIYSYARTDDQIAEDFVSRAADYATTWHIPVNPAHDGHRWLQYKAVLENVTPKVTPVLSSITINCREYEEHPAPDMRTPKIAFMSNRDGNYDIYIMDIDGSNQINLTDHPGKDETPSISSNGQSIIFDSDRKGNFDIFVMDVDGSNVRALTTNSAMDMHARYSPDGNMIVFQSNRDGDYDIYVMSVEGELDWIQQVTSNNLPDYQGSFSPDSERICFWRIVDNGGDLFIIDSDGMNETRLTYGNKGGANCKFSPDGEKIIYQGYDIVTRIDEEISEIKIDQGEVSIKKLTDNTIGDWCPMYSPDGIKIVFISARPDDKDMEIFIMDNDGSNPIQLTFTGSATWNEKREDQPFWWSPQGTTPPTFYKYPGNPVLEPGPGWRFDSSQISNCSVIKEDNTYRMWYLGSDGSSSRAGYAESEDGLAWIVHQGSEAKDSVFDYSSSFRGPCVIKDGNKYKMWFFDGTHTIKMATSDDGIEWDSGGVVQVLTAGESGKFDSNYVNDPRVIKVGEKYHMWYGGNDGTEGRTGYATSDDGITWERQYGSYEKGSIMPLGETGDFDSARTAHTPVVIYSNGVFMMWYYGHEGQYPSRIGYAYSRDGNNWTKVKGSEQGGSVLDAGATGEFDDVAIWPWSVIKDEGIYKMWYGGEYNNVSRIGFARSKPYSATETAIAQDKTAPTMEDITETDNQWYKNAPVFSNFGFDDDLALDDAWYQMDGYTGSWSKLFEDAAGKAWDKDGGSVFIGAGTGGAAEPTYFENQLEGEHTLYFKADDDKGNVGGKNGEWSWPFKKDTQKPVTSYTITQGTKGKQNWYGKVPVNISLSAYDGASGVSNSGGPDSTYYSKVDADPPDKKGTSITLDEDGEFQPVFLSIDLAGNGEQINRSLQTIRVDLSDPQITVADIEANSPDGDYLADKEDAVGADRAFWFNGNQDMVVNVSVPWIDRYNDADSTANMDEIVAKVVETTQVLLMGSTGGSKAIMGSPAVCAIDMQGSSDTPVGSTVTLDLTAYDYGGNSIQAAVALEPDNDGPELTLEEPQYDTFKDRDGDPITFISGTNEYKAKKCSNGNDTIVLKAAVNDGSGSGAGRVTADLSPLGGDENEAFTEDNGTFELIFAGSTTESVTTTLPVTVSGYDRVENKADETVDVLLDNKTPKITLARPDSNAVDPRSLRTAVEVVFTIESDGPDSTTNGCVPGSVRVVFTGKDPIILPGKTYAANNTYTVRIDKKIAGKDHGDTPVHELEDTVDGYGGDSYSVHVEAADWAGNWGISNAVTFTYDEDCEELTENDDIEDYQWSPDGEWIIYQRADGSVWCMKPDGSGLRSLIPKGAYNKLSNVTLSPDGRFLAFQGIDKKPLRTDIDIFVMNFDRDGDQEPDEKFITVNVMKEVLVDINGDPATNGVTKEISSLPGFDEETDNNILPQWKPLALERDDPGKFYREPADGTLLTQYAYQVSYHTMKSSSKGKQGGVFMRSAAGLQGRVDGSGALIQSNLSGEIELFSERGFYRLETRWITPSDVLMQGTRLSRGGPAKLHLFLCQYDPRDASSNKVSHATPVKLPVAWQGIPAVKVLQWKHMQGALLKRSRGNLPDGIASLEDIYGSYGKKVFLAFQAGDRATGVSSLWKGVLIFRDDEQAKWGREFDVDVCRLKIGSVDGTVVRSSTGSIEESCLHPDFCPDFDWVVFERTITVTTGGKKEKVSRLYLATFGGIMEKTGTGERDIAITSVIKKARLGEGKVSYCFPKWCPAAASGDGNYHHVMFKKVYHDPQTGKVKQNLAVIKVGQ